MASRLAWLLTLRGRGIMAGAATAATCLVGAAEFLPQTLLIDYYRDFVALRKNDSPLPVPDGLNSLFKQVLNDLSLHDYHKLISRPFMVFGFEMFHIGSLASRAGTYIGMPINFTYTNVKAIPKDTTFINNEPVNWQRDDAKQLLESLIMSENAQKYAIAREVLLTDNKSFIFSSLNSSLAVAVIYGVSSKMNDHLELRERPRSLRLLMYSLISAFVWGLWAAQRDGMVRYYETEVDEHIAQLGENYLRGGIEYYEKMLQRNRAMRTLLGNEGSSLFNADGDYIFFIRQKHLQVSHRKEFFEKKLKEKTEGKEGVGEAIAAVN